MKNENFDYYESCDIEINIRRLKTRPTTDLYIDYKTLTEIREKQITN